MKFLIKHKFVVLLLIVAATLLVSACSSLRRDKCDSCPTWSKTLNNTPTTEENQV